MADGYSWAADRLGVAMVTRGPGVMNAATACRTAVQGGRRVLVICGDGPLGGDPVFDNKLIDQRPVAQALGLRHFTGRDPREALDALRAALVCADHGEPALLAVAGRPVHGPRRAGGARVGFGLRSGRRGARALGGRRAGRRRHRRRARRGARTAGREPRPADPRRPRCLHADRPETRWWPSPSAVDALLGTTLLAKDLFRGEAAQPSASSAALPLIRPPSCWERSTALLAFGARLTPFTTAQRTLFRDASVVQVDHNPDRLGDAFPVTLGIAADGAATAGALVGPPGYRGGRLSGILGSRRRGWPA